jgi:hypothetical protein
MHTQASLTNLRYDLIGATVQAYLFSEAVNRIEQEKTNKIIKEYH